MSKTTQTQQVEAGDNQRPLGEIHLSGNVGKIERFKGYIKIYPKDGGWILRLPPSKLIIHPYDKTQAKEIAKIYKQIQKEKLGTILKENIEIIKKYGFLQDTVINQFKGKGDLTKLTKKELIALLQEKLKEED